MRCFYLRDYSVQSPLSLNYENSYLALHVSCCEHIHLHNTGSKLRGLGANNFYIFVCFSIVVFCLPAARLQVTYMPTADALCIRPPESNTTYLPITTSARCTPALDAVTRTHDSIASAGTSDSNVVSIRNSSVPYAKKSLSTNTTCCCTWRLTSSETICEKNHLLCPSSYLPSIFLVRIVIYGSKNYIIATSCKGFILIFSLGNICLT